MSSPLRKSEIIRRLELRIVGGEFVSGEKLPSERELAEHYGVSRPVIREGLSGLVERGLVDIQAGRGTFVREVAVDELSQSLNRVAARTGITTRHLVEARLMVEVTAARYAAAMPRRSMEAMDDALQRHEDARTLVDRVSTDLEFHEAIATASGNPVIALMFGSIRVQVYSLMLRSHSDPHVREIGDPQHRKLTEAIRSGDADLAGDLMADHLSLALSLFGDDVDRPISEMLENRGIAGAPPLEM
jgi:GntR family transcriptional regulator, transcriptional repressor for pyruvate dehydrogenase complex